MCYILLNLLIFLYLFDFAGIFILIHLFTPIPGAFSLAEQGTSRISHLSKTASVCLVPSRWSPAGLALDLSHMALYLHSYDMFVFFP